MPDGVKTVATFTCDTASTITLQTSLYKHPYDFENGDDSGEAIFYTSGNQPPVILYDDNFMPTDNNRLPGPDADFAPLPAAKNTPTVTVFALPPPFKHRATGEFPPPPYLNIFLDPATTTPAQYTAIANCLTANTKGINASLANITAGFPTRDQGSPALQLGGLVLGKPDYQDQAYLSQVKNFWNAADTHPAIPPLGSFLLFPGQIASGIIAGTHVTFSIDSAGNQTVLANGKPVIPAAGWNFGDTICTSETLSHCAKMITYAAHYDDGSESFDIAVKTGPNSFADQP